MVTRMTIAEIEHRIDRIDEQIDRVMEVFNELNDQRTRLFDEWLRKKGMKAPFPSLLTIHNSKT